MTSLCVFDVEANGFLEEADRIHCIVNRDYYTKEVFRGYNDGEPLSPTDISTEEALEVLKTFDVICGHNIIGYDFDVIEKILGEDLSERKCIDTLVMSQTLNPDRQLPKGCPTSVKNPITGKLDKITPHSVAAWGYRLGRYKVENHDWTVFTPHMLKRCEEDVEIQTEILDALCKEAGITVEELLK